MTVEIIRRATEHGDRTAIEDATGRHTYRTLLDTSAQVASGLATAGARPTAFLVTPGFACVAVLLGIWRAGRMAVPMATSHPPAELEYALRDSGAGSVVADALHATRLEGIGARLGVAIRTVEDLLEQPEAPGRRPEGPISRDETHGTQQSYHEGTDGHGP